MRTVVAILLVIAAHSEIFCQTDSLYSVEFYATASPSITAFDHERYPGAPNEPRIGYAVTSRVMWHPSRLLALGIMSGYTLISSETLPSDSSVSDGISAEATLRSIPLQAVVSMQGQHVEVGVCMGPHWVLTTIDDGMPAHGSRVELNLTVLANYRFHLATDLYIAPELRISYFSYRGVLSVMPSITFRYDVFNY